MIKRIQLLETYFGSDDGDNSPEGLIIFTEAASKEDTEPLPIMKFFFNGEAIHRLPDEPYPAFEARAVKEALKLLPKQPGQPAPVPVLIADGSLQE